MQEICKVRVRYRWGAGMWRRRMVGGMQSEDVLLDTNVGLPFFFVVYLVASSPAPTFSLAYPAAPLVGLVDSSVNPKTCRVAPSKQDKRVHKR